MSAQNPSDFSVFKPVGHVVAWFPPDADPEGAVRALREAGFGQDEVIQFTADQMVERADKDLKSAGPLAFAGYEITLARIRRKFAEEGFGFVVVPTEDEDAIQRAMMILVRHGARFAQHYGRIVIEELLKPEPA